MANINIETFIYTTRIKDTESVYILVSDRLSIIEQTVDEYYLVSQSDWHRLDIFYSNRLDKLILTNLN